MKKKWMIISTGAFLAVVAIILGAVIAITNNNAPKDLKKIVGTQVSLAEGVLYCESATPEMLEDDFSKVYSETVRFNVESIDEDKMVATITISAPPLKEIMEYCLPENMDDDLDAAFEEYMADVYSAIKDCPAESLVTATVHCSVVENDGMKIVPNNDFTNAVFPDIQQMLAELLMEVLAVAEG